MEKKIPIDKLFHDQLADGREQLNLGAWANMERMLDGKNPYSGEDERKRRGLFPFMIALLAGLAITGTTYLLRTGLPSSSSAHQVAAVSDQAQAEASHQQMPASLNQDAVQTDFDEPQPSGQKPSGHGKSSAGISDPSHLSNASARSIGKNETLDNATVIESSPSADAAVNATSSPTHAQPDQALNLTPSPARKKMRNRLSRQIHTNQALVSQNISANHEEASGPELPQPLNKLVKSIPMVTVNQTAVIGRNGKLEMRNDTVDRSTYNQEIEMPAVSARLDWTKTNPRYKPLNHEEEANAALHREPQRMETQAEAKLATISTTTQPESTTASRENSKHEQHSGAMDHLVSFASRTFEKVNNMLLYKAKPDLYTSLLMGVNTSLNSLKNNFGGFQGGLSVLRPISDYLSFVTECKFYYRKNGGYTANDIYFNILDPQIDTVSLGHIQQTVYSYQKDSIIKTYNFKNFYTFELPLMMQFNYRAFALYGGVNLAYSMRLSTTEKSRNYVNTFHDTVQNAMTYSFPVERASQYMRSDFSSRFGVGYTVGASFSFSPQLYFDLRVAQNVWDNAKTNAARELSSGFFKVPSIQFSLGYRFRNFSPDN